MQFIKIFTTYDRGDVFVLGLMGQAVLVIVSYEVYPNYNLY